jgi:hypothetical protein
VYREGELMTLLGWVNDALSFLHTWKDELGVLGGLAGAIFLGGWTLYHFLATRRVEARQPFLNKQLELYFKAAAVVGKFAVLEPKTETWTENEDEFWSLYWSELSVVESKNVEGAMVAVGKAVTACRKAVGGEDRHALKDRKEDLKRASYNLAHAIRESVERGWRGRL